MLFQPELGLSVRDLLGRSADSVCWTPLQKKKKQKGSAGAHPLPLRCLRQLFSGEENIKFLGNEFFVRTFHRWGNLVFIMDDHDNFPN